MISLTCNGRASAIPYLTSCSSVWPSCKCSLSFVFFTVAANLHIVCPLRNMLLSEIQVFMALHGEAVVPVLSSPSGSLASCSSGLNYM